MMTDKGKTILVVDDEPDILDFLSTLFSDNGYQTATAADGEVALEKVKSAPPDLITLDITMPEKSGVKFYRDIKESDQWKQIPVIIVTGVTGDFEKFISTRRQIPAPEGYMAKPIEKEKIMEMIKKLLGA
jgi:CheY-like chemotaxis protein